MSYKEVVKVWAKRQSTDLLDRFFLKFTYSSIKIDSDETIFRDVETVFKGEKIIGFKGNKNTIKEIENHKRLCQNLLKLSEENNAKLSIDLIKQVHHELMKGCFTEELLLKNEKPGEFKKGDFIVGFHGVGVEPSDVEGDLNSLIKEINGLEINENNALEVISYFNCRFHTIHPFADGDGRVGRVLINYLLLGNNLPPIIIFYNDGEYYYLALEFFKETQEIDKMITFLEDQAFKTWCKNYNVKVKSLKDFLH